MVQGTDFSFQESSTNFFLIATINLSPNVGELSPINFVCKNVVRIFYEIKEPTTENYKNSIAQFRIELDMIAHTHVQWIKTTKPKLLIYYFIRKTLTWLKLTNDTVCNMSTKLCNKTVSELKTDSALESISSRSYGCTVFMFIIENKVEQVGTHICSEVNCCSLHRV